MQDITPDLIASIATRLFNEAHGGAAAPQSDVGMPQHAPQGTELPGAVANTPPSVYGIPTPTADRSAAGSGHVNHATGLPHRAELPAHAGLPSHERLRNDAAVPNHFGLPNQQHVPGHSSIPSYGQVPQPGSRSGSFFAYRIVLHCPAIRLPQAIPATPRRVCERSCTKSALPSMVLNRDAVPRFPTKM